MSADKIAPSASKPAESVAGKPPQNSAIMNTYGERSTTLVKAEGVYAWDNRGIRYLDALMGIAVCGLGHCHPEVTRAIAEQAATLVHCSNLYLNEPQQQLGKALIAASGMSKVFFSNSGTEANEAAIKIARKYANDRGIHAAEIITTQGSFHGRTMAALTATGNEKIKAGFAPLVSGFVHVPYDDIAAIEAAATANTVAVMVEPVQGEGGIRVPGGNYLQQLRALCDQKGWLLILDEIQSGNGRTGRYFAYQHSGILPDVCTTAKGLGNGVPIGACLAAGKAAEVLQPGNHGSTFGGNPLATRAALAVVELLTQGSLMADAARLGESMIASFRQRLAGNAGVKEVRGKGMMIGIELTQPCGELVERAKQKQLLINVTAGNTIRLLPALILTQEQADTIVDTVCALIAEFTAPAK